MLIVDDKYIFIHMPKSGGSSYCQGLVPKLEPYRVLQYGYIANTPGRSPDKLLWKHARARDILASLGEQYFSHRRILVSAREPIERVCSFYFFAQRRQMNEPGSYPWAAELSLSGYFRSAYLLADTIDDFACDESGESLVDEVVPFAEMSAHFQSTLSTLGLPKGRFPHLNRAPQQIDYHSLVSPEDRRYLEQRFESDYRRYGKLLRRPLRID